MLPSPASSNPRFVEIESADDARIAPFNNLPDRQLQHGAEGLFIAEGEMVVRRLLASRYSTHSILMVRGKVDAMSEALAGLDEGVPIFVADQALVTAIIGFPMHRGVLALGRRGPDMDWRTVAAAARSLVIIEDLTNHDNIGGIFRNAAALGGPACAVLLTQRAADPLYRKSIRVSMGHALGVPFAKIASVEAAAPDLRALGFTLVALTTGPDSVAIESAAVPNRAAIVVGTEGAGLSASARAASDRRVVIPMAAGVDSLNVYVAAAVAMHRLFPRPV